MNKKEIKKLGDGPLTLRGLIVYNEKVFLPKLEKMFVSKKEFNEFKKEMMGFKKEITEFKKEMTKFKVEMTNFKKEMLVFQTVMLEFKRKMEDFVTEMTEFKNAMLTNQDIILKKLDILIGEKKVQVHQEDKRKKMCGVMVGAATRHGMITPRQVEQIEGLGVL